MFINSGVHVLFTLASQASIDGLEFIFPNCATEWKTMYGELCTYLGAQILNVGFVPMEKMRDNAFKRVTTSTKRFSFRLCELKHLQRTWTCRRRKQAIQFSELRLRQTVL